MKETILVTGGAGFIGSHVCDALLKAGKRVICIDNTEDYSRIEQNFTNPEFDYFNIDITCFVDLLRIFHSKRIDKILHLAGKTGVRNSLKYPKEYVNVNIIGTINLLNLCDEFNIKNFVFASSSSVYGSNNVVPFTEKQNVNECESPYACTKSSCEMFCYTYSMLFNLNVTCLRFFTVYGPRGRKDMAPYIFTKNIIEGIPIDKFGNGDSKRDYTYVEDIVQGILSALDKNFRFEIFNLGNSKVVSLNDFIGIIEKKVGKKAKIHQCINQLGDVPVTCASIKKAKKFLDYDPKTEIVEGMGKFVDWFKENQK